MRPVEGFVRPNLGFHCSESILHMLTISTHFDNFEFDIFDAGSSLCRFATSVTIAVRIRKLSVHKLNLVCSDQSKPFNVRPSLICPSMFGPG